MGRLFGVGVPRVQGLVRDVPMPHEEAVDVCFSYDRRTRLVATTHRVLITPAHGLDELFALGARDLPSLVVGGPGVKSHEQGAKFTAATSLTSCGFVVGTSTGLLVFVDSHNNTSALKFAAIANQPVTRLCASTPSQCVAFTRSAACFLAHPLQCTHVVQLSEMGLSFPPPNVPESPVVTPEPAPVPLPPKVSNQGRVMRSNGRGGRRQPGIVRRVVHTPAPPTAQGKQPGPRSPLPPMSARENNARALASKGIIDGDCWTAHHRCLVMVVGGWGCVAKVSPSPGGNVVLDCSWMACPAKVVGVSAHMVRCGGKFVVLASQHTLWLFENAVAPSDQASLPQLRAVHCLSIPQRMGLYTHKVLGSVQALAFDPTGTTVGVAWERGGLAALHVSKAVTLQLLPPDEDDGSDRVDPLANASFRSLQWAPHCSELVAVPLRWREVDGSRGLWVAGVECVRELRFVHGDLPVLAGDGYLLVARIPPAPSLGCARWEQFAIPTEYNSACAPMRHVATSPLGDAVALAGSHGVAVLIHSEHSEPYWSLFPDKQQEQQLDIQALCFVTNDVLVVSATIHPSGPQTTTWNELILYPRTQLDSPHIIGRYKLSGRVRSVDCNGKWLCAHLLPWLLVLYEVVPRPSVQGRPTVHLELVHSFSLQPALPRGLKELMLTECVGVGQANHLPRVVLLDHDHACHIISLDAGVSTCVSAFTYGVWLPKGAMVPSSNPNSGSCNVWTCENQRGVVLHVVSSEPEQRGEPDSRAASPVESFSNVLPSDGSHTPFGLARGGLSSSAICLTSGVTSLAPQSSCLAVTPSHSMVAHHLLASLLGAPAHGADVEGGNVVRRCRVVLGNVHPADRQLVLESLLHVHVERLLALGIDSVSQHALACRRASVGSQESSSSRPTRAMHAYLNTCRFVLAQPKSQLAIAGCVRKMEESHWSLFFPEPFGEPFPLFTEWFKAGEVEACRVLLAVVRAVCAVEDTKAATTSLIGFYEAAGDAQTARSLGEFLSVVC